MAAARAVTLTVVIGPLETVSEGVLDSRNVRVSISAPEGPSAFSVWEGVRNVVDNISRCRRQPHPLVQVGDRVRCSRAICGRSKRHVRRYGSTKELVGAAANGGLPAQQLPSLGYAWLVAQGLSGGPAGLFARQRDLSSPSVTRVIQAG